jgi:hypothetical protein
MRGRVLAFGLNGEGLTLFVGFYGGGVAPASGFIEG